MSNKVLRFAILAVTFVILTPMSMFFNSANGQNLPERQRPLPDANVRRLRLAPFLPPSDAVEYRIITGSERITGRLGLLSARLIDVPPELNEIAVWIPPQINPSALKPDDVAYELISSVRYRGAGKELVVATYRLSPGAARLQRFLGNAENLADGTLAGINVVEQGNYPNRIVFERGNSIVVIGGNLSIEEIKRLAATAQLK